MALWEFNESPSKFFRLLLLGAILRKVLLSEFEFLCGNPCIFLSPGLCDYFTTLSYQVATFWGSLSLENWLTQSQWTEFYAVDDIDCNAERGRRYFPVKLVIQGTFPLSPWSKQLCVVSHGDPQVQRHQDWRQQISWIMPRPQHRSCAPNPQSI